MQDGRSRNRDSLAAAMLAFDAAPPESRIAVVEW